MKRKRIMAIMVAVVLPVLLVGLVAPAGTVKADSSPPEFTFMGGSLTTTNTGSWDGYNSHSYGVHFNVDAGPVTIEYLGVHAYPINYTGDFGWPPDPTDTGASVIVGFGDGVNIAQYSFKSNMSGSRPRGTSPETYGKGSWDYQDIGHWNDDGYRSYLFQGQFTGNWVATVGNSQFNAERHGGPFGNDPDYDTFDVKMYIKNVVPNTYEVTGWHRLWKSSAIDEGCYWDWNYAGNAHDPAKQGYLEAFEGTWTADGGLDLSDVQPFLAIQNWQGTQPELHTFDWDNVKVSGTVVPPDEVWVDDNWTGLSPGDAADGHTFGYDAFATIQDGIDAVGGSTVHVAAGTYNEDVTVDKSLTLSGAQTGVDARGRSASESEIVGVVVVTSGATDVVFDGLKLTSPTRGFTPRGFNLHVESENSTIKNCIFVAEENAGHDWSGYLDFGGITNTTVERNSFSGDLDPTQAPNVIMLGITGAGTVTIANNEMHDVGGGGGIGIMCSNDFAVINIEDNEFDNTGDGIWIWTFSPQTFSVSITGNDIHDCEKYGVKLVGGSVGEVHINHNNIYNNLDGGCNNEVATSVDATCNWWGAADGPGPVGPGSGDTVSTNVTFTPWLIGMAPDGLCIGAPDTEGPVTTDVVADPNPAPVGTAIDLTANVDDSTTGGSNIASAEYNIDGGSWTAMSAQDGDFDEVSEDVTANIGPFAEPGVHEVCVRGMDAADNTGDPECILLAVYDPSAGFVTGGGWIDSPEGAYYPDETLTGKATFGFVSRYKKGANVPTGNTEFQFKAGDLNFHSTSYDWLVVTGSDYARFKGMGTINGEDSYKFMLWAGDGTGDGGADTFRIKISSEESETVVYDNSMNQPISGGQIVVHTMKK